MGKKKIGRVWTEEEKAAKRAEWKRVFRYQGDGSVCIRCNEYLPDIRFRRYKGWEKKSEFCLECMKTPECQELLRDAAALRREIWRRERKIQHRKAVFEYLYERQCDWCKNRAELTGEEPVIRSPENLFFVWNDPSAKPVGYTISHTLSESTLRKAMESASVLCHSCRRERNSWINAKPDDADEKAEELARLSMITGIVVKPFNKGVSGNKRQGLQESERDRERAERARKELELVNQRLFGKVIKEDGG